MFRAPMRAILHWFSLSSPLTVRKQRLQDVGLQLGLALGVGAAFVGVFLGGVGRGRESEQKTKRRHPIGVPPPPASPPRTLSATSSFQSWRSSGAEASAAVASVMVCVSMLFSLLEQRVKQSKNVFVFSLSRLTHGVSCAASRTGFLVCKLHDRHPIMHSREGKKEGKKIKGGNGTSTRCPFANPPSLSPQSIHPHTRARIKSWGSRSPRPAVCPLHRWRR